MEKIENLPEDVRHKPVSELIKLHSQLDEAIAGKGLRLANHISPAAAKRAKCEVKTRLSVLARRGNSEAAAYLAERARRSQPRLSV